MKNLKLKMQNYDAKIKIKNQPLAISHQQNAKIKMQNAKLEDYFPNHLPTYIPFNQLTNHQLTKYKGG
jgi:hypothetical protein